MVERDLRRNDASLRLLAAASRLRVFTRAELAAHAGVAPEAANSFLRRSEHVEVTDRQRRSFGRGRPQAVWRLRPDQGEPVAAYLAEMNATLDQPQRAEAPMSREPSSLRLLLATLEDLEERRVADPSGRRRALDLASIHLRSAEARLDDRRSLSLVVSDQEIADVKHARVRLRQLEISGGPPPVHEEPALDGVRRFVADWTAPMPMPAAALPAAEAELAQREPEAFLENAMPAAGEVGEMAVYRLAADLLRLRRAWETPRGRGLGTTLRLQLGVPGNSAGRTAALAVAAAVIDDVEAPGPLLRALLVPGLLADATEGERWACLAAMARLSRPSRGRVRPEAAAACLHLLATLSIGREREVFALGPAALAAPYSDSVALLHQLAGAMFGDAGEIPGWREQVDEGAVIRNVAMVLHATRFDKLQEQIGGLLQREYGQSFIMALISRQHGGLALRDQDGEHAFVAMAGPALAEYLGVNDQPVPLRIDKSMRGRLSTMLTELTWADQPHTPTGRAWSPTMLDELSRTDQPADVDFVDASRASAPAAAGDTLPAHQPPSNVVLFPRLTDGLASRARRVAS